KAAARARKADRRTEALASLAALRPGDVIEVQAGKFSGWAVVVDPGLGNPDEPRPYVLTLDRHARRLAPMDFPVPVEARTRLKVPRNFNGRNPTMRRDLARALQGRIKGLERTGRRSGPRQGPHLVEDERVDALRSRLKSHPCHACP